TLKVVVENNALPWLLALLRSSKPQMKKEVCWVVSNIAAGTQDQVQAVIDAELVPTVVKLLGTEVLAIRQEAGHVISNLVSGSIPEHIHHVVEQGCLEPVLDLLLEEQDPEVVMLALNTVESILKAGAAEAKTQGRTTNEMTWLIMDCDGFDRISYLQQHEDDEIYSKVRRI
ncbi:unnamed protein product, partial [Discosporangium mesarthrocarpum]